MDAFNRVFLTLFTVAFITGCGSDRVEPGSGGGGSDPAAGGAGGSDPVASGAGGSDPVASGAGGSLPLEIGPSWPDAPNDYSWDGSWTPDAEPEGLYDAIYFDGHAVEGAPSPILPPGEWDWQADALLANYRNFAGRVGEFALLRDTDGLAFGWRLNRVDQVGVEVDAVMEYFHGSSGADIIDFGPEGSYASADGSVQLGDGPDLLRYRKGQSAAIHLGSSLTGSERDDDLALIGRQAALGMGQYDVVTSTVHTGPGSDLVFVNNFERAAIDLGNGNDGSTDTLDPRDAADIVVIGNNARDFRVFGGRGNDTFFWYVDEVQHDGWLGPDFFGGGGWGDALWNDDGIDRLVLVVPEDTVVVATPGEVVPGSFLINVELDKGPEIDEPTQNDPHARYYGLAPASADGERTVTVQYVSADETVDTAYFYLTDVEEIQLGVGDAAPVYRVDDVTGEYERDDELTALSFVPSRAQYESLIETFAR